MFFIRAGSIVAWLAVVLGALRFLMGLGVAFISDPDLNLALSQRYLGHAGAGGAMDGGLKVFVIGIVIGLLVQTAKQTMPHNNN